MKGTATLSETHAKSLEPSTKTDQSFLEEMKKI